MRPLPIRQRQLGVETFQFGKRLPFEILEPDFRKIPARNQVSIVQVLLHENSVGGHDVLRHVFRGHVLELKEGQDFPIQVQHGPIDVVRITDDVDEFRLGEEAEQMKNPAGIVRTLQDQGPAAVIEGRLAQNVQIHPVPAGQLFLRQALHREVFVQIGSCPPRERHMMNR